MTLLIFAVWAVLWGGHVAMYLDAAGVDKPTKCPESLPMTCKDIKAVGHRDVVRLSGGLEVMCDGNTDGGGWIVIQRRVHEDVDFYRDWVDYKYGFGDIRRSFWLGNEKIHRLTSQRAYQMRVDLTFKGAQWFAQYSHFRIYGEKEKYRLEVGGYSGNAGDSLAIHNGMPFSTKDRDNDAYSGDCSYNYHGAWWYNKCLQPANSNLNGWWGTVVFGQGLIWSTLFGMYSSPTSVEMKIRPID